MSKKDISNNSLDSSPSPLGETKGAPTKLNLQEFLNQDQKKVPSDQPQ